MEESILKTIRMTRGLDKNCSDFDEDLVMYINSAFGALNQIGVGPGEGFVVTGEESKWTDFISDNKLLESYKTYVSLTVRLLFDPPSTSYVIAAVENMRTEAEWRLSVNAKPAVVAEEGS